MIQYLMFLCPVLQHQTAVLHHRCPPADVRRWCWAKWNQSRDRGWGSRENRREVCKMPTSTSHHNVIHNMNETVTWICPVSQWLSVAGSEGSDCETVWSESHSHECHPERRALLTVLQQLPQHPHTRWTHHPSLIHTHPDALCFIHLLVSS